MKLCSCSPQYKNIIPIILEDNIKNFNQIDGINFTGQIDKKSFLNFCLESDSVKIIEKILKNQQLVETIDVNRLTVKLVLKSKKLSFSKKTYIYTKIIKNRLKITDNWLFKQILKYDLRALTWLEKSQKLNHSHYKMLFYSEIDNNILQFCRKRKIDLSNIIIKSNKIRPINIEDYSYLLSSHELYDFIACGLNYIDKKELDVNLLDSIIKILINHQYLIENIDLNLLRKIYFKNEQFFDFLSLDIEKLLLYNKFSQKKFKQKVNKI